MEGFNQKVLVLKNYPVADQRGPTPVLWRALLRWPSLHGPLPGTHSPAPSSPAPTPPTTRHWGEHVILPKAKGDLY